MNQPAWHDSVMMKAVRREPTARPPVWLMRQAGRYMAEYRAVREKVGFLELCRTPRLAAEIMLTAVETLNVDAAIIFSDLLPILEPMGFGLEFTPSDGPVVHRPIRTPDDVRRVVPLIEPNDLEPISYVFDVVEATRRGLSPDLPLIGFAGAPFTLAGYAIEGGGSKDFRNTKTFMYRYPDAWRELMEKLADTLAAYLNAQADAGVQIVQVFDSWVGCLSDTDYRTCVLPYSKRLLEQVRTVPSIHFGTGNPALLPLLREAGGDIIGVDWRLSLEKAWEAIGPDRGIQGNLDPVVLLSDPETIRASVRKMLRLAGGKPGHIVNLGHGVLPQTPVEHARVMVETVKAYTSYTEGS
ncbi:MAG TPA: uroporphyrinogen decarboxylase [Planctomycetaceae bacterium]|nr:uroporphyrinogen decarboxylase [Planctomycetaceae bacterium]